VKVEKNGGLPGMPGSKIPDIAAVHVIELRLAGLERVEIADGLAERLSSRACFGE
jgi:hypothetical protein